MTFGLSAATIATIGLTGATLYSANQQSKAAKSAAQIQAEAAVSGGEAQSRATELAIAEQRRASEAAIAEQRRQFDKVQSLLQPFTQAGTTALQGMAPFAAAGAPALQAQQAFLGLQGPAAERAAIERISGGETFQALARQGEEGLLQQASATGGLRGGNIQGALAQFRPALLSSLIEQQYSRLGGMTALGAETTDRLASLGQAAAAGTGAAATSSGTAISNLLSGQGTSISNLLSGQGAAANLAQQQQAAALAGGQLAAGRASSAIPSALAGSLGTYISLGGKF
jgi:hypothetical protein